MTVTDLSSATRVIEADDRPVSFAMSSSSPSERIEPVTLDLVKKHLRFQTTTEDDLLTAWIAAARVYFEEQSGRQIVSAVYEYALDRFPDCRLIQLPRPPLLGDVSVEYDDGDGEPIMLDPDSYRVIPSIVLEGSPATGVIDPFCKRGFIELKGTAWPATALQAQAVRIRRTCGYGATVDDVPALIQAALYLLIAHFHRNRNEVMTDPTGRASAVQLPMGASMILDGFKKTALPTRQPRQSTGYGWGV